MKRLVVLAGILALAPLGAFASDPALFQLSVKDVPVDFIPTRIAGEESERYTVTFPQIAPEPGKGFTMAQCELLRY
ncbi:hypothetical protein ACEN88_33635 [Massilia sp. CT11-108]|jgi:hypothetical protein|uniref:hypothetical protein n=1 Tax=Massilia sp. CT11-108 TaxID=3393900 RepID=UPI0039A71484